MSGKSFTPIQLGELGATVTDAVSIALPRVAAKFDDPEAVLDGIRDKKFVLATRLERALELAIMSMLMLIRRGQVSIALSTEHDPEGYYRTCVTLHVSDDFRKWIVSEATRTIAGAEFKVNIDELGDNLTEAKIENGLPKKHLFDNGTVCALIAELISRQPNGEAGDLENTGKANLLFTSSHVACVYRDADHGCWHVRAWQRAESTWNAGGRVLSPMP